MPKSKLFDNWTWKRNLPKPFDNLSAKQIVACSKYNETGKTETTLHAPTLSALLAYASIAEKGEGGATGKNGNTFVTEYPSHRNELHVCVYDKTTGRFTAGIFKDISSNEPYELKSNGSGQSGAALFFSLIPAALSDLEFQNEYTNLLYYQKNGFADISGAARTAAILCDNLYRRIENADSLGENGIKVNIPATGNIQPFTALKLAKGEYNPSEVINGKFVIFTPTPSKKYRKSDIVEIQDFTGKYVLSEREFTEKEKQMIPRLEDWYIIPDEVVQVCRHAKMTTGSTVKMRNFMFRGPSGAGKTEGAKAIAAGLGLPYAYITCSANTEITELLGQILPDVKTGSGSQPDNTASTPVSYPTLEDIQMDPSTAYYKLTGEYKSGITENDVYNKLIETIRNEAANRENGGGQGYRYIDTDLVNAIRYGWLIELQEPSIIANPGVLVGLNALLDNCKMVTLPTGEIIKRHPDTVIIVTTNCDYNGCKELNQSVISRMNMIFDVEEPDIEVLAERAMKVTKYGDKNTIRKMAATIKDISEKCRETMIKDGCCGTRELISWVQSYMITGDILESAEYTVLPSVSSDPENRAEIKSTCLNPKYGKSAA